MNVLGGSSRGPCVHLQLVVACKRLHMEDASLDEDTDLHDYSWLFSN